MRRKSGNTGGSMNYARILSRTMLAPATLCAAFALADDFSDPGRRIFELRCQSCHVQGAGPSLVGVLGRKAGTADSGVHSSAAVEYGAIWTRSSLRRYISEPGREMPGTLMRASVPDSKELDDLLNYLETIR
jgi:cytochrome c